MSDQSLTIAVDSPPQTDLTDKNCHLSAAAQPKPDSEPQYKRVRAEESAKFYRLRKEGLTLDQIAALCERSVETVYRHLELYEQDTTDDARKLYAGSQLDVAATVLDRLHDGDGRVALKAAEIAHRVGGLLDDTRPQMNVAVVLGVTLQPPSDPPVDT